MKHRFFLSFLLVLTLLTSVCCSPAMAAEAESSTVTETVAETENILLSGTIGESNVTWLFHPDSALLEIDGTGTSEPFTSSEDQPWKELREQIRVIQFDGTRGLKLESLSHWFCGLTEVAEIRIPKSVIGSLDPEEFEDCTNLSQLWYEGVDLLVDHDINPLVGNCDIDGCECTGCSWKWVYPRTDDRYHWATEGCTKCSAYVPYAYEKQPHNYVKSWTGCQYTSKCACGITGPSGYSHSYSYGSATYYSTSQHKRTGRCTNCSSTTTKYESHSTTVSYARYTADQHQVTNRCTACATDISTSYASHTFTCGSWTDYSDTQHRRTRICAQCGYSDYEYADHTDSDGDTYCDICDHLMTRFSVTVPTSMAMTVSRTGAVYAADNSQIVNHSTGAVQLTGISVIAENGWQLIPFACDLAGAKVDSKQIGFRIAGCDTLLQGTKEQLDVTNLNIIPKGGSLLLPYIAVISAISKPIYERVLTVEFTVDWA